jgi:hypothetical protein
MLDTPEGRAALAAAYRRDYAEGRDRWGWEHARYLRGADAIEAADWPALGQVLRDVERDRVAAEQWDHQQILALARTLCRAEKGADL